MRLKSQLMLRFLQKLTHKIMMDGFLRNRSVSWPGKMKFRKKFWSFPGFANKG